MNHLALPIFWKRLAALPEPVRQLAHKNYALLRADSFHPSLHFKKVGKNKTLWSVRVGEHYRALGLDKSEGVVWFWVGTHAEYDKLIA